ncbi:response regulator transcription factor [Thermodesulfobacteriota bacterium]
MFKILVVEDNDLFRQTLMDSLKQQFPLFAIDEARDGKEAIVKTGTFLPDLIFMDIRLPGASGLELTKEIKFANPEVIIVIITSYDLSEYKEKATSSGASFFLPKISLTEEKITEIVKRFSSECDRS